MPPGGKLQGRGDRRSASWIKAGAVWPEGGRREEPPSLAQYVITPEQRAFWAFQPVRKPSRPR